MPFSARNRPVVRPGPRDRREPGQTTILVAEDAPEVLACVVESLQRFGYNVLAAVDGLEALQVAAQHSGLIDLLLTDIEMPRLDGHGLSASLSCRRPEARTLFMSGGSDASLPPGTPFLPKPFAAGQLLGKVHEALRGPVA